MTTFTGDRTGRTYDTRGGRVLGSGGGGTVTLTGDGQDAVKVLAEPLAEPLLLSCRTQWVQAAALEPYRAVVTETAGTTALILRPVAGQTLEQWMAVWFKKDRSGHTPDLPAARLLVEVAHALAAAVAALNRLGWRTDDLKPANVMAEIVGGRLVGLLVIDPDSVVLAAKVRLGDGSTAAVEPATNGTPDYVRPERTAVGSSLPFAFDDGAWALAVCVYQLLYLGKHPAASTDPRTAGQSFDELLANGHCPRWTDPAHCPKGPVTYAVDPAVGRLLGATFTAKAPAGRAAPADFERALAAWRADFGPRPQRVRAARRGAGRAGHAARRAVRHLSPSAASAFVLVALVWVCWAKWSAGVPGPGVAAPEVAPAKKKPDYPLPDRTWSKLWD